MVTIEMSSLSENHLLAAILANGHMITAVICRGRRASVDRGSAFPNLLFFLVNANLTEREKFLKIGRGPNFSLHVHDA